MCGEERAVESDRPLSFSGMIPDGVEAGTISLVTAQASLRKNPPSP